MCLGIPGRITEIWTEDGTPMAHADFAGTVHRTCLTFLVTPPGEPGLRVGDYVISHTGYALTRLPEREALQTIAVMREYGIVEQDPAPGKAGGSS